MSGIRANRETLSTYSKTSLVLLPFLGTAITANASAQVISAGEGTATVVNQDSSQFDITGGQRSNDGINLFHNFEQFGLSSGQIANFETVPSVQNVIGNVSGSQASKINGTLQVSGSDANLYLMNPAGILLGPDSQLNLSGGFTATAATGIGFENGEFDAATGDYGQLTGAPTSFQFEGEQAGAVVNAGNLSVATGSAIGLVGGTVVNTGSLRAPEGTVTIAAVEGESRVRISQGDRLLSLEVESIDPSQTVPTITAQSIGSMLTGSGLSDATALTVGPDGTVRLEERIVDENAGSAIAAGSIITSGEIGGDVDVLGSSVSLIGANIDASGRNGAGSVRIGGDYRGEGSVVNATRTLFDRDSVVLANAVSRGNGGRVIVWADDATDFHGSINATGGATSGNGGFVEISGKKWLAATGKLDLGASYGNFGTVLLDPENLVITDQTPAPLDNNTSYLSSSYVESLSDTADVDLEATNNFTIEPLTDGELSFREDRSVTFRADSDGNGVGSFSMDAGDTIRAEKGDVSISGAGVSVGTIDTSTDDDETHGYSGVFFGGAVSLRSSLGVSANEILTFGEREGSHSATGGSVLLEGLGGAVTVKNGIRTYSRAEGHEAESGGSIEINASQGIYIGTDSSVGDVLDSSSVADEYSSRFGGDILLSAMTGDIVIKGGINALSLAEEEQRTANNYIQGGGTVNLRAASGSVVARDITTSATANIEDSDNGRAGDGGSISIDAGVDIRTGAIDTASRTKGDISGEGGLVRLVANSDIRTGDITTDSIAADGAGRAGDITLEAQRVVVDGISGVSTELPVSNSADIRLTGDTINLNGGPNSVWGSSIELAPLTASKDMQVGSNDSSLSLDISALEIAAIGRGVQNIRIGRADSTGSVRLNNSVTSANDADRAPINILGARTLIGSDEGNTYESDLANQGRVIGSGSAVTTFENVSNLRGGAGNDTFKISPGSPANRFEGIDGGSGANTTDYSNFTSGVTLSLAGLSNSKVIGPSGMGQINTLVGVDTDTVWRISGLDAGSVETASGRIDFEGFNNLEGRAENDLFFVENAGNLSGYILGGDGSDTLNYGNYDSDVEVNLEDRTASGIDTFGSIEGINGSTQTNKIIGFAGNDVFKIKGDRVGQVIQQSTSEEVAFSEFEILDGSSGNDRVQLDLPEPASSSRWTIDGIGAGAFELLNNSAREVRFEDFEQVQGGSSDDTFDVLEGGFVQSILGQEGSDTISYGSRDRPISVDLQNGTITSEEGQTKFFDIDRLTGSSQSDSTLTGLDSGSDWQITGVNSGSVDSVFFSHFDKLVGGEGSDTFSFSDEGVIDGSIEGGVGRDRLDYSSYSWPIELFLDDNRVKDSLSRFSGIQEISGNSETGQIARIVGSDRDTSWKISATDSGSIDGLSFKGFNDLVGGRGNDQFSFTGDGAITGQIIGGAGTDTLNYKEHTSALMLYPDRVIGENSAAVTERFSKIERVLSSDVDVLHSSTEVNRFEAQRNGDVELGGITFSGVTSLVGGDRNAVLDYSKFDRAIAVDLENSSGGGLGFRNIGSIVGSAGDFKNTVLGTAGNDRFEILGDREISADGLLLSRFSTVNGGDGDNQFVVNKPLTSNVVIEGGSDRIGVRNTIISEVRGANWRLPGGADRGRLEGSTGTVLAEFEQVQNLKNRTSGEVHNVFFENFNSQITGSIDSGNSDLILIGNDINIGRGDGRNVVGGAIAGTGTLKIVPESARVDIEIGGEDSQGAALNITSGELAAIQDSFSQVVIGDRRLAGNLLLKQDTEFSTDVVLQSGGEIDTNGYGILADGSVSIEGSRIAASRIDSSDGVSLTAKNDVVAGATSASGQGVEIVSEAGSISIGGMIDTDGQQEGSGVRLSAQRSVVVGDIRTEGGENSGSVEISSTSGGIAAGGISTRIPRLEDGKLSAVSGSVTLSAKENIEVEFIDARGGGDRSNSSGFITIETEEDFTATGVLPGTENSLSTAGVENGTISILYGNPSRLEKAFLVGQDSDNGTTGSIRAALEIVLGDVPSGTSEGGITIIDRGFRLPEPRTPEVPLKIVEPLTEQVSVSEVAVAQRGASNSKEMLRNLETGIGGGFESYLNLSGEDAQQLVTTLEGIQKTLQDVEEDTEVKPALAYVYFVPDAASEAAITAQTGEQTAPDDQLEVMLITATGDPIRKRQWGVTREQIEAASLELRQQITSQFTTARQYLQPAQQLYDWIVRPIARTLEEEQIESVGFVMDTGLRTMPLATLHDGDRYLVENYSLGLLPTFSLTQFRDGRGSSVDLDNSRVLAMGASQFEEQPDLPAVDEEIKLIAEELWEGDAFLNEDFVLENLQAQIKGQEYGVVHLATHASFESGDLGNSYIQLWNERLALDDIGKLGLDESEVSLIILSACNTALGDTASEYGFAGFAVTAGSESALASLWPVNDEGTLGFMSQFYSELKVAPVRADALRQAQISLIRGEVGIDSGVVYDAVGNEIAVLPSLAESGRWDFSHPFFWSAFTMIGNPW